MQEQIENKELQMLGDNRLAQIDCRVKLPYYTDENITIYNDDCLTVMPALRPLNGVIVTDPPYGISVATTGFVGGNNLAKAKDYEKQNWDREKLPRIYIEMMKYISRHQIIFGGNYYGECLGNTKSYIVWDKDNSGNFADCELAWTSYDRAVRKIKHRWNGMLQQNMKEKEERLHPTQKPLPVMIEIIEDYTTPEDIIIDPFMGSGTTLVAAATLGRKAVGIEINPKYCDIAVKRLQTIQTRMTV